MPGGAQQRQRAKKRKSEVLPKVDGFFVKKRYVLVLYQQIIQGGENNQTRCYFQDGRH